LGTHVTPDADEISIERQAFYLSDRQADQKMRDRIHMPLLLG
jgi:hypothetical protein